MKVVDHPVGLNVLNKDYYYLTSNGQCYTKSTVFDIFFYAFATSLLYKRR